MLVFGKPVTGTESAQMFFETSGKTGVTILLSGAYADFRKELRESLSPLGFEREGSDKFFAPAANQDDFLAIVKSVHALGVNVFTPHDEVEEYLQ